MGPAKVMLVEDYPNLGYVIKDYLTFKGYKTTLFEDGEQAWRGFTESPFDICVLDIMLPKKNGFELLKAIRGSNAEIPVIFISARALDEDKITGLRLGADDYIVKPFSVEELYLRIEVFLNRPKKMQPVETVVQIGAYWFDYPNHQLNSASGSIQITHKEAQILKLLYTHLNQTVERETILQLIWGDTDYFMGRSLDVYLSRLRKYMLDDPSVEIVNVYGVGFKLAIRIAYP
ncbi:response regulator [Spirosoma sp. HMF4905]|uniref:Response regulator n=1 Tax=Spirosoma arboris TaxID=2682092 RepID=A0A7K1SJB4_9BACT|nr:response regulator transcription factor [Spirosoma arboris]MVM33666.1 response regulator [Spirosoma arboris]